MELSTALDAAVKEKSLQGIEHRFLDSPVRSLVTILTGKQLFVS